MVFDKDIFGRVLLAQLRGTSGQHVVERSDGYLDPMPTKAYFDSDWGSGEAAAMKLVHGRVLDIGCGAGRHALRLQKRGLKVTGIDSSPLAIKVCRERGLQDARVLDLKDIAKLSGSNFDSVIMFGNNFGLFGTPSRARRLLRVMHRITAPGATLYAGSLDVHQTSDPDHFAYQRWNRRHGRPAGQIRLRVRWGRRVGPWFEWLHASPSEMRVILKGTGWRLRQVLPGPGPLFVAAIGKC